MHYAFKLCMKAYSSLITMVAGMLISVAPCTGSELPFQFNNGLVWVKVNTPKGPMNFILDSGASESVIDQSAAHRIGLSTGATQSFSGVNGRGTAQWVSGLEADCAGTCLKKSLLAIDLSKPSCACGRKIDGLLGADFLRGRVVQIDFASRRVRFLERMGVSNRGEVLPVRTPNGVLCVPVAVNGGKPEWVRLDTGSNGALEAVRSGPARETSRKTMIGLSNSSGSTGGKARVKIGNLELFGVHVGWHQNPIFPGEGGLLGTQVLSRFKVTLDGVSNRVILE